MDYEFRIKLAERDLAHLQELQTIARDRQDTTDVRLDQIQGILLQTMGTVQRIAGQVEALTGKVDALTGEVKALTAAQQVTQKSLQDLIAALLREHTNGGGKVI